jgi:UDP-glucose 4-epimerase
LANAPRVLGQLVLEYAAVYLARGKMLPTLDRVYVNERARRVLGWEPI